MFLYVSGTRPIDWWHSRGRGGPEDKNNRSTKNIYIFPTDNHCTSTNLRSGLRCYSDPGTFPDAGQKQWSPAFPIGFLVSTALGLSPVYYACPTQDGNSPLEVNRSIINVPNVNVCGKYHVSTSSGATCCCERSSAVTARRNMICFVRCDPASPPW